MSNGRSSPEGRARLSSAHRIIRRLFASWRAEDRRALPLVVLAILFLFAVCAFGEQRFPPPDFESGHQLPVTAQPAPRVFLLQYLDVAVLVGCLGVATWLVFRKRSRAGLIALSVLSLFYFGFYRRGCVCAIGSLQN